MAEDDPVLDEAVLYSEAAEGPEKGRAYWVYADDGTRLRVGHWEAESVRREQHLFSQVDQNTLKSMVERLEISNS